MEKFRQAVYIAEIHRCRVCWIDEHLQTVQGHFDGVDVDAVFFECVQNCEKAYQYSYGVSLCRVSVDVRDGCFTCEIGVEVANMSGNAFLRVEQENALFPLTWKDIIGIGVLVNDE